MRARAAERRGVVGVRSTSMTDDVACPGKAALHKAATMGRGWLGSTAPARPPASQGRQHPRRPCGVVASTSVPRHGVWTILGLLGLLAGATTYARGQGASRWPPPGGRAQPQERAALVA